MAEYAGYVSSTPIDWSGIAKGLQENVDRGLQARQKKIDEDNKLFDDAKKKLGEFQNTQSTTYNQKALALTEDAKNKISTWNKQLKSGELTREEYKMKMTNINEQYDSFINTSKQFDQYITAVNQKINSGEASSLFVAKAKANSDFMNLGNSGANLTADENGDIYITVGNQPKSIKQWSNIQNLADEKVDVNAQVNSYVDKLGEVVRSSTAASGASVTTDDARQKKEQYDAIKTNAIASIASKDNPTAIVSILTDNSDLGYFIYSNQDDLNRAINNEVDKQEISNGDATLTDAQKEEITNKIKSRGIFLTEGSDGSLQPQINDAMVSDARKVVDQYFEAQVSSKITDEAASAYRGTGNRGGNGNNKDDEYEPTKYERIAGIYTTGGSTNTAGDLSNYTVGGYKVGYDSTGFYVYKTDKKGKPTNVKRFTNLNQVDYAFYGNSKDQMKAFKKDSDAYWKGRTGNTDGELD
jgi:hypothetical protein